MSVGGDQPEPARAAHQRAAHAGPRVLVLGEVRVEGTRGSVDPARAAQLAEIAAYVALRPGATMAQLAQDIWPYGTTANHRNTIAARLRAWLGSTESGEPYFPPTRAGVRFSAGVGCDLSEFRNLYERGMHAYEAGEFPVAAGRLERAIGLVRGRPFAAVPEGRYGWAGEIFKGAGREIVSAALCLARIRMAERAWDAAAAAAGRGMAMGPDPDGILGPDYKALAQVWVEAEVRSGDRYEA